MALLVRQDVGEVTRPTIEDVLARTEVCGEGLFTATADGPVFSADGTLAVIRTDPELAGELLEIAEALADLAAIRVVPEAMADRVRAAAVPLAAPAPADPKEDGDE